MAEQILRLPEVKARTGLSRSTIYAAMAEGKFPKTVALAVRTVGWVESEINDWIDERIRASRGGDDKTRALAA